MAAHRFASFPHVVVIAIIYIQCSQGRVVQFTLNPEDDIAVTSSVFCKSNNLGESSCDTLLSNIRSRIPHDFTRPFQLPIQFDDTIQVPVVINNANHSITLRSKTENTEALARGFARIYSLEEPGASQALTSYLNRKIAEFSKLPVEAWVPEAEYARMYELRLKPWNHYNSSITYEAFIADRAEFVQKNTAALARMWEENGWSSSLNHIPYPSIVGRDPALMSTRGNFFFTAPHKLTHDKQQLEHLMERGLLPPSFSAAASAYQSVLDALGPEHPPERYVVLRPHVYAAIGALYNTNVYLPTHFPFSVARVLSPSLDTAALEAQYLDAATRGEPGVISFDGFLSREALLALRDFAHDATLFFDVKPGYLGAYADDEMQHPLLARLVAELRDAFPTVIGARKLTHLWAYKYAQDQRGIRVHADAAEVNLNFWVTEDEANLDPDTGGLVVYKAKPPASWGGAAVNDWSQEEAMREYVRSAGAGAVRVPHRCNRVVMFDSSLFHETDRFSFKPGYRNRRINYTLLFGDPVRQ